MLQRAQLHSWPVLVSAVKSHIRSLNFGYRSALHTENITYINAYAEFASPNSVTATDSTGSKRTLTADNYVVAVGGRPHLLDIPGKEHAITSDDIFWRDEAPGKTLVVGAAYVALECAGVLTGLGYTTSVMARSVVLRGFDQDMSERIVADMTERGTRFLRNTSPTRIERTQGGKLEVHAVDTAGTKVVEEYDTVLMAVGELSVWTSQRER